MPVVLPLEGAFRIDAKIISSHRPFLIELHDRTLGCLDGVRCEARFSAYTYYKPVSRENIIPFTSSSEQL